MFLVVIDGGLTCSFVWTPSLLRNQSLFAFQLAAPAMPLAAAHTSRSSSAGDWWWESTDRAQVSIYYVEVWWYGLDWTTRQYQKDKNYIARWKTDNTLVMVGTNMVKLVLFNWFCKDFAKNAITGAKTGLIAVRIKFQNDLRFIDWVLFSALNWIIAPSFILFPGMFVLNMVNF